MRVSRFRAVVIGNLLGICYGQRTPTLGLQDGFLTIDTPSFSIQLVKDSQTLASLKPKPAFSNNPAFDFAPFDQLTLRQYNGNYHFGDVTFRARVVGSSQWVTGGMGSDSQRSLHSQAFNRYFRSTPHRDCVSCWGNYSRRRQFSADPPWLHS